MQKELQSFKNHQVADVVPACSVPPDNNIIGRQWVFKFNVDGQFQARLPVQHWGHRHGFDCGSTVTPVCRLESLLGIVTAKYWLILVPGVQTAFSKTAVRETLLRRQPLGLETSEVTTREPHVMQLHRILRSLRQSPNVWNSTVDSGARK